MESDKIRFFFVVSNFFVQFSICKLDLRGKSAAHCGLWYQYLHVVVVQLDDALPTDAWGYTLFLDTFRIHARS